MAGGERLAGLKAEVTRVAAVPMPVPTDVGVGDEIARLKARLVAAEEERDAALRSNSSKRQATMPRTSGVRIRTDDIPPMPSVVPAESRQWLLDRQSDLQETLELGGPPDLVFATHIHVVRRGSADDGDERRNGSVIVARTVSRWGARGQRIGEAKNRGPRVGRCSSRRTVLDSDSDVPLVTRGRFSVLSTESDKDEEDAGQTVAVAVATGCAGDCDRVAVPTEDSDRRR